MGIVGWKCQPDTMRLCTCTARQERPELKSRTWSLTPSSRLKFRYVTLSEFTAMGPVILPALTAMGPVTLSALTVVSSVTLSEFICVHMCECHCHAHGT